MKSVSAKKLFLAWLCAISPSCELHAIKTTSQDDPCPGMYYSKSCSVYPGKLVVMVTVGDDFLDFFENWYLSAAPHLDCQSVQLLAIAEDEAGDAGLRKLREQRGWDFDIRTSSSVLDRDPALLQASWDYEDHEYLVWMARRPAYIDRLMQSGCSVLFNDIDAAWKGDAFAELQKYKGGAADLQGYDDNGYGFCGGFIYFNPTDFTKEVVKAWADLLTQPGRNQHKFNLALKDAEEKHNGTHDVHVLPRDKFVGGYTDDTADAVFVHANWRVGAESKRKYLQAQAVWKLGS
eukprot:gb/GFBE01048092.1/.p1 GENE.gb/GFBE01048092.1/~~gb/GFBE01048092.1/.p1  ORF type:complete len:291 (+),score=60.18 gb/GFBE01048092.1/:1-873(+)